MALFYLQVFDDIAARNEEPIEAASEVAAVELAVRGARELAAQQVLAGRLNLSHRIEVADETGDDLRTVYVRDAIRIVG